MRKKLTAILFSALMILGLAACGNSEKEAGQLSTAGDSANEITDHVTADESGADNAGSANISESQQETGEENDELQQTDTENADTGTVDTQETKVLVVYFSATNTTEGVAQHIANGLNADIYEIIPEEPYTDADLNYNDNNSRTTIEMNDPAARSAISGSVEEMGQYDIVFLGYAGGIIGLN
ncbi:MAG: hypothetical protein NC409_13715 [Clostridium sp.]|nr:hypothetical protein [Clostridium sp.]